MATFPASKALPVEIGGTGEMSVPVSLVSDWFNATNGISLATAPVYTRTTAIGLDASITLPNTPPFYRDQGRGTNIITRLVYDNVHSAVGTAPQYMLIGRKKNYATSGGAGMDEGGGTAWQFLPNRNGDVVVTLTPDLNNDIKFTGSGGATLRATTYVLATHTHDCMGCDEFWIIPIVAISATGGTVTLDRIEAKII